MNQHHLRLSSKQVVEDKVEGYKKTKEAVLLLKKLKAWNDIKKVYACQRVRAGKGKMRNRRRILRLAPCGHVGRFCIWTESAFRKLDELYGTRRKPASLKVGYK
ncbi:60S ribosomal protein L4-like [Epinephelus moara]|uniref:60S ribosomal protein L4-like n=1 Tax=Epinephelus moara TaxID=300413 RepID=UPI00214F4049|nr:60S ribosomal protein L4-like [Epinephelus moara]